MVDPAPRTMAVCAPGLRVVKIAASRSNKICTSAFNCGSNRSAYPPIQRVVFAGVRGDFRPLQTELPQLQHPQFVGHQQDPHEQRRELWQEPPAEGVEAIVIRMGSPGEVQHRNQFVGRPFDLPAGENPLGITVEQQR